jgi:hypothetical protein
MFSKWRVGRKLGRSLYFQEGPEPSDDDRFLGLMEKAELAELVVEAVGRFNAEFKAPFVNSVWEPRYPSDPQHDDPLKVVDAHGGAYLCAVMDGGSSTVRRSALHLNLYYRRTEKGL